MVEQILAQNGLNAGLHKPNHVSPLSEYVWQTEFPRGWKVPKFIMFYGDTNESTIKLVARYQTKTDEIVNNENLKMKYFLNYLTKISLMWFTIFHQYSIFNWNIL